MTNTPATPAHAEPAGTEPTPRIASWEYHPETEMPIALCTADADILTATTDEDDNVCIGISLADTRRIQAAWNAVEAAGITTTALERGVLFDLLKACNVALIFCETGAKGVIDAEYERLVVAPLRDALAKAAAR